jgi:hypothetical protein
MIHPARNTISDEYAAWVRMRGYPQDQADYCMAMIKRMGYDMSRKGLFQSCFEVIRNNRANLLVNDITFDMLRLVARDGAIERLNQTWLTFIINYFFSDRLRVMPVSQNLITDGDLMQWYEHNSMKKNEERPSIEPVMFDRIAKIWQ